MSSAKCWCIAVLLVLSPAARAADARSTALLHLALAAQGGEQKLRALKSVQWEASGYRNELEESERPEGPYITDFLTVSEVHDFAGRRFRSRTDSSVYPVYRTSAVSVVDGDVAMRSNGGPAAAGTPQQVQLARERMALSPERLLITALDASDTHTEPDTTLQSVAQNVVTFTLDGAPVRIFLNAYTHLPTAVDYSGPLAHSNFWRFLGDVTQRTYYGEWWLAKGGIHLPMQMNVEGNGYLDQLLVISKLQIDVPLKDADLTIPPDVRAQFQPNAKPRDLEQIPLGNPKEPAIEITSGIVFIPGSWNITFVKQEDGVVLLEAPISSGYSAEVIAEAHRRFPGIAVKAVITTSDSWPHLAGIRQYVAEGIPIYALDLNRPILDRVIDDPRKSKPDALARTPRKPQFHLVHEKTLLGTGANRMEIIPIHGETSERQMMVYFPEHHLLYGSDPFQQMPDGSFFYPQTVTELMDAVAREHLQVDRFFMMHIGPTPWSKLEEAVEAAEKQDTPSGVLPVY
ncbi:MAG: hypothetical protein ACJ71S_14405 [Acidobacteriaceae bacterium]